MDRDLVCGLIGFAVALLYLHAAAGIPESGLGDTVGSAGFPHALGYCLAVTSALFVVVRLIVLRGVKAVAAPLTGTAFDTPLSAFMSAAGTALICAVFIFLFEPAGYILSIAFLILALCMYQNERLNARLLLVAAGGALVLWVLFAVLLAVRMPPGIWADLV